MSSSGFRIVHSAPKKLPLYFARISRRTMERISLRLLHSDLGGSVTALGTDRRSRAMRIALVEAMRGGDILSAPPSTRAPMFSNLAIQPPRIPILHRRHFAPDRVNSIAAMLLRQHIAIEQ